jgi:hypothetical protein
MKIRLAAASVKQPRLLGLASFDDYLKAVIGRDERDGEA